MYRTLYPESAPGLQPLYRRVTSSHGNSRPFSLEKSQCVRFQYRYHLGWLKKLLGIVMILISLVLLAWNEKTAVLSSRSFHEGMESVTVLTNPNDVLVENQGKLVHIHGYLNIFEPLQDQPYGVSIPAVKLKRRVQMYQWIEYDNSFTSGDGFQNAYSSYRYEKDWKDKLIDSSNFASKDHENPAQFAIESQVQINSKVYIGGFLLGPELKDKFNDFTQFTSDERPFNQEIKMHMGLYYHSQDLWNPRVGDLRIQFSFAGPSDSYVSVIAKQSGNELRSFYTESGSQVAFIHEGKKNHIEIFTKEYSQISMYYFRCLAWVFTFLGAALASRTINLLNRRNVIVQNLMSLGPTQFSFIFATFLSLSTIAAMWFHHKPLFGFLLAVFSCFLLLYYALLGCEPTNGRRGVNNSNRRTYLPYYSKK